MAGVARPVLKFMAVGLLVMALVGAVAAMFLRHTYVNTEIRDAKTVTANIVRGPVQAAATDQLLQGDAGELARMDDEVRRDVIGTVVIAVKLWSVDGRIVYSTDRDQIGARDPLDRTDTEPLRDGHITGDVSRLSEPDDAPERRLGRQLLEVYQVVRTPTGTPLLLESYVEFAPIRDGARSILVSSIPVLLGALVVFELVQVPLAMSMARRVQRAERREDALLEQALTASDNERRRIASDLHDGVVQDLAGLNYTLTEAADSAASREDDELAQALLSAAGTTRQSIQALRTLFVQIYPANLRNAGLASALADLVGSIATNRTATTVEVAPGLNLGDRVEALIYRAAQEAIRNAAHHANASMVSVSVSESGNEAVLEVVDDGRGFTPGDYLDPSTDGHLGLRLISEWATDLDGRLFIISAPDRGTRLRLEVPL
jgi:signal transduction histidine kinase